MHGYWLEFLQVAVAHLLAVASPGPDFAIVLRQSLARGRGAALWTSLGIGTAILVHVGYSLLGLGLLVRSSELWFTIVKFAGAAYLGWLGVQALRAKPRSEEVVGAPTGSRTRLIFPRSLRVRGRAGRPSLPETQSGHKAAPTAATFRAFAKGFLTNALNPKATLFFVSLYVLIVSPQTPKLVQAGYGLWMAAVTAGWFSLVSLLFTHAGVRRRFLRHGHWIDRALGVVFIAFAGSLLFASVR